MSPPWDDNLIAFVPLPLFGVLALVAGLFAVVTEWAERRRARRFAPRPRAWRFRPVVIQGGKVEPEPPVADAPVVSISSLRA